ncbi:hypothetical protein [Campylobacter jejuni]|uniref:hypothetical protein n=1 Tax=Campylobacter jejuni TaxID=197 RepID=UPI000F812BDE|nr:hypothetical protein [Campylobacter jejuni]RTJ69015.1 hypothetical protein C3H56_03135 [Campylobacter jejuni]RTJ76185.1 hypothetical protein C3H54_05630 [Campylobacter jejuni]RTJ85805.1 hypothetical protein C3H47_03120 [Campylobacter jejuni]
MGTSLNELKTGREKLEIINQVLARISDVATALDNTRIEEIIGLKEQVNNFYTQTLELKNLVIENSELTQSNADFVKNKKDEIEKISNKINDTLNNIENIYNNIIESEKNINNGVNIVKEKYPELNAFNKNFEIIKIKLEEYYDIAVDFNAVLEKVEENKNLTKSYLDLSIELKEQILQELEHAQSIKDDLHSNIELVNKLVSNIIATKNEIISITNDFKNVKSEVQDIVNDAEATIKLKINTILFENQRLNQNMINLLKRCEKLEDEIVGKYEDVLEAIEIVNKADETINDLNNAILASKEFANDLKSYTQIIKDFKIQIDNLKLDLQSYNDRLKGELDLKANEIDISIQAKLSDINLLKEQMQTLYENTKNTTDTALANFIERAKIANEDLGRLTEVAKTELANDKTAIESYLLELKQSIIDEMKKVSNDITDETSGILAQKNQIELIIAQGKLALDTLTNEFNSNYQNKLNEFNSNANEKLRAINSLSEESIANIQSKTDENIGKLNTASEEKLAKFDEIIKDNLGGIYSHIFSIENVLLDKKIIKLSYKE